MNKITIFETFAGIGSQIKALKNISNKFNLKVESLGFVEWYLDAIISYEIINNKILKQDKKTNIEDIKKSLSSLKISSDSKNIVSPNYFSKLTEERLRSIYPYLKKFIKKNTWERERALKLLPWYKWC
ncbi:DNA (cytosine-5-)-methyltransferase N-terminal subunit [Mycoplasmopsis felis]|uniref:DNA (cytosine-5-)-methyltransferase N-terminal subunit n=1 Tax=Mycoplasmopsis felis TaxID=33923 RepID=UPI003A4D494F